MMNSKRMRCRELWDRCPRRPTGCRCTPGPAAPSRRTPRCVVRGPATHCRRRLHREPAAIPRPTRGTTTIAAMTTLGCFVCVGTALATAPAAQLFAHQPRCPTCDVVLHDDRRGSERRASDRHQAKAGMPTRKNRRVAGHRRTQRRYVVSTTLPDVPRNDMGVPAPTPTEQLRLQTGTSYEETASGVPVIAAPEQ